MILRCGLLGSLRIRVVSRASAAETLSLVEAGHANREHLPGELPYIEAEGAANRRVVNINQLDVHARVACVPGVIVAAHDEFFRVSILTENIGSRAIEFNPFRHDHVSQLNVKAEIPNCADGQLSIRNEIVQSPAVALTLQK